MHPTLKHFSVIFLLALAALVGGCSRSGFQQVCEEVDCSGRGICVVHGGNAVGCLCDPGYVNDGPLACVAAPEPEPADAATTDAPMADTPMTDAPMTDAPTTDAPMTDLPMTDASITDLPMTDAPMTDSAGTDIGDSDGPITLPDATLRDAASSNTCNLADQVSNLIVHGTIVAEAGGAAVTDQLELAPGATGFVPQASTEPWGTLTLEVSGVFNLSPGSAATTVDYQVTITTPLGNESGCLRIHIVDTGAMSVLVGQDWDDGASWGPNGPPSTVGTAYISPGNHTVSSAPLVAQLFVASGASLEVSGVLLPALIVQGGAYVGGRVGGGLARISGSAAGRFEALSCRGDLVLESALSAVTMDDDMLGCRLDLASHRLSLEQYLTLDGSNSGLKMDQTTAQLHVKSDINAVLQSYDLSAGLISGGGNYRLSFSGPGPVGSHAVLLGGDGPIVILSTSFASLYLPNAPADAIISAGAQASFVSVDRELTVQAGQLVVETLVLGDLFSTTTPASIVVTGTCSDPPASTGVCDSLGPPP